MYAPPQETGLPDSLDSRGNSTVNLARKVGLRLKIDKPFERLNSANKQFNSGQEKFSEN